MRRAILLAMLFCLAAPASALGGDEQRVRGGFELSGYLNTVMGFQHFSDESITERADDGSYGGPIGEWIPDTRSPFPPAPGTNRLTFAVPNLELDIVKHFGERARLRADLFFGRPASGSDIANTAISHAYGAVTLSKEHGIELLIGRFGLPPGFEPYEAYWNDTISWSIIWRALIAPGAGTGVRLSYAPWEHLDLFFAATNGLVHDWTSKLNDLPTFTLSALFKWGDKAKESTFALTPFVGPESGGNTPITVGADATLSWWMTKQWQLGLEAIYQRDDAAAGGVDTSYWGGLVNLHWEPTPAWYGVLKYAMTWQGAPGNGVLNLTGAEQVVHEMSLGMGHFLADGMKLKLEARFDIVDPPGAAAQWVGGGALALSCAY
jgi:hypothetical protein